MKLLRRKNNLQEDGVKASIRIPIWPSQIPDLAKFLLYFDIYGADIIAFPVLVRLLSSLILLIMEFHSKLQRGLRAIASFIIPHEQPQSNRSLLLFLLLF